MKKLFDSLESIINSGDFSKLGYLLKSEFAKALEVFNDSAFMETIRKAMKSLGEYFGQGIMGSLEKNMPPWLKYVLPSGGGDKSTSQLLQEAQKTNAFLASIERTNGTYA